MKKLGIAMLVAIGVLVTGGVALYVYADSEFTRCYGIFNARDAAERAADAGRDEVLDASVDHRASESAVEFDFGKTGDDAREQRRAFRQIVRRERGIPGHGSTGCLERKPFDH